ncbi:Cyclic di-GMP phosphodiesterase response regulator RpfG [Planctomycetes bacterium CA13]|uniref:Cyclic di-GMP phosphodiesterase response regulator RpfG n=1 Tax=Novipirellula herctigrandis TaxID=2527986 RepID=A0A5C5YMY2_9BACT|nr:Cyclic di-GMP phosphodiesterase response regulator RpfG [Planctomycetes bacterium CA13]
MTKQRKLPIGSLVEGAKLTSDIPDPENTRVKLLTAGTTITKDFLENLYSRNINGLVVSEKDIAVMSAFKPQGRSVSVPPTHQYVSSHAINQETLMLDERIENTLTASLAPQGSPFDSNIRKITNRPYDKELTLAWAADSGESIDQIETIFSEAVTSQSSSATSLHQACQAILTWMIEDIDAAVCMACSPFETQYPARHGFHFAQLAMAIGMQMKLDQATLIDLGIGCMIHDVGMKAVGVGMFGNDQMLSPGQLKLLADHPIRGAEVIAKFGEQISMDSKMVAYQVHERCDGSGYPRGRRGPEIHALAKIASVADAYIGMVTNRPHRVAILGYHAMVHILNEMKVGKFDPHVVRALLEITSLHPLGSFVELSNHCIGRTIRTSGAHYDKPIIEMWSGSSLASKPVIVNLQEDPSISIVRIKKSPAAA